MCRLIVFTLNSPALPDLKQDPSSYKRGDVIEILADGQHAGKEVEASSWWRIIDLPGIAVDDPRLEKLIRPGMLRDPALPMRTTHRAHKRALHLDLDALETGHRRLVSRDLSAEDSLLLNLDAIERSIVAKRHDL